MFFKKMYILFIFLIIMFTVSSASALENENGTFTDFQNEINNVETDEFEFERNYSYHDGDSQINIDKANFTVDGKNHVIDGKEKTGIMKINKDNVTLKNIIFKNGNTSESGGAIFTTSNHITLLNCTFINNNAISGGSVLFTGGSSCSVINCTFINNSALGGGSLRIFSTDCTVVNSSFENNQAIFGGGIYWSGSNALISNSKFNNNSALENGYGIYCESENARIINSLFNSSSEFDEIFISSTSTVNLKNNTLNKGYIKVNYGKILSKSYIFILNNHNDFLYNFTGKAFDDNYNLIILNNISLIVDDIFHLETVYDGLTFKAKYNFTKLGKHSISAVSDNLKNLSVISNPISIKLNSTLNALNVTSFYHDGSYLNITLSDTSGKSIAGKVISVSVNDHIMNYTTDDNGEVHFKTDLNPGKYDVEIFFMGDDEYYKSFTMAKINVLKAQTYLNVTNVTCNYNDGSKFNIQLYDNSGKGISNKSLLIDIDGNNLTGMTNNNGKINFDINFIPGFYNVCVIFKDEPGYYNTSAMATIHILKAKTYLKANNLICDYNSNKSLKISLYDKYGKLIKNKKITTITNKEKRVKYLVTGQISITINYAPGKYKITTKFNGDSCYEPSSTVSNIVVNKLKTQISISKNSFKSKAKNKKVKVVLKDNNKKTIKKAKLTLNVKGKKYTAKTNSKGVAAFKIKLNKKSKYKATVKFKGNAYYKKLTKTFKIKIK